MKAELIILIISSFITFGFGPYILNKALKHDDWIHVISSFFIMFTTLYILSFVPNIYYTSKNPKAIDVYQGKTELKVSYDIIGNDTIVKDSTVIWKGEKL